MIDLTAATDRHITLGEEHRGDCVCCGQDRDVTTLITYVVMPDSCLHPAGSVEICGACIAAALAIHLAAGHHPEETG